MKNMLILFVTTAVLSAHGCNDCCTVQADCGQCCVCPQKCDCDMTEGCQGGTKTFPVEPGVYPIRLEDQKVFRDYALVYYDIPLGTIRQMPVLRAKFNDADIVITTPLTPEQEKKCQLVWGARIQEPDAYRLMAAQILKREKYLSDGPRHQNHYEKAKCKSGDHVHRKCRGSRGCGR